MEQIAENPEKFSSLHQLHFSVSEEQAQISVFLMAQFEGFLISDIKPSPLH